MESANGSVVFLPRMETDEDRALLSESASTPEEIAIACWKGKNSVNLLVSKAETDHLLEKFGRVSRPRRAGGHQGGGDGGQQLSSERLV